MYTKLPTASIKGLIAARDERVHMSSLMLLRIVDHITISKPEGALIGEVMGFYKEHTAQNKSKELVDYTYSGIATMLRTMRKKGYLGIEHEGHCIKYYLTPAGIKILDRMYI